MSEKEPELCPECKLPLVSYCRKCKGLFIIINQEVDPNIPINPNAKTYQGYKEPTEQKGGVK